MTKLPDTPKASQTKSDRKKPVRCLIEVRKLPIECFRHPEHAGRQWRSHANKLRNLLCEMASYANPDGTFGKYSPSVERLSKHHSERSVYRLLDELHQLGLLDWTRESHYARRNYRILLPRLNTCQTQADTPNNHLSNSDTKEAQSFKITCQTEEKHLPTVAGETPASSGRYPSLDSRPSPSGSPTCWRTKRETENRVSRHPAEAELTAFVVGQHRYFCKKLGVDAKWERKGITPERFERLAQRVIASVYATGGQINSANQLDQAIDAYLARGELAFGKPN